MITSGTAYADKGYAPGTSFGRPPESDRSADPAADGGDTVLAGELSLGMDLVVGIGETPVMAAPTSEGTPAQLAPQTQAPFVTQSFLLAAGYQASEHVGIGLRFPLSFGTADPDGALAPRSAFALGNLELEGELAVPLARDIRLTFVLGVAWPTGQGSEMPRLGGGHATAKGERLEGSTRDLDQGAIQRSASSLRGYEDQALYELDRLGIVPKIAFDYRAGMLLFRPYAKLENLISTAGAGMVTRDYLVELVLAAYVGLVLNANVDVGARVWGNLPILGGGASVTVIEPQISAHVGRVGLALGGIWPVAGELTKPQFAGLRALVSAHI